MTDEKPSKIKANINVRAIVRCVSLVIRKIDVFEAFRGFWRTACEQFANHCKSIVYERNEQNRTKTNMGAQGLAEMERTRQEPPHVVGALLFAPNEPLIFHAFFSLLSFLAEHRCSPGRDPALGCSGEVG